MINQYNRKLASDYAIRWALARNPKFYAFDNIGGDCTNYISQCLLAGGGVMDYNKYFGWYYESQHNRSPSWTSVKFLQKFLLENKTKGPFAKVENINNLQIGDLIQLKQTYVNDYNHTLFISNIINGQLYVCAHNDDSKNRPFSSYNYISAMGLHIEGIYI